MKSLRPPSPGMLKRDPSKLLLCTLQIPIRRTSTHAPASPPPPTRGATKLTNRRLISIHGADSSHFLQGLTTNTINPRQTSGHYSAFLTAQGRVLNDVFIYPSAHSQTWTETLPASFSRTDPGYLIEVDAAQAEKLVTHVKRYKLRARIAVRLLDEGEWDVWSLWGEGEGGKPPAAAAGGGMIGCLDARAPGMGRRVVLPGGSEFEQQQRPLHDYTVRRMLKGVAEGQTEIVREIALPHESNLDLMGAVDFRKGCYVGQELTIRTQHTGVVRKRILPVRLYYEEKDQPPPMELVYDPPSPPQQQLPPAGTNIFRVGDERKRAVGKWLDGVENIGLALCRLEIMTGSAIAGKRPEQQESEPEREFMAEWVTENGRLDGRIKVKAFVPPWHGMARGRRDER